MEEVPGRALSAASYRLDLSTNQIHILDQRLADQPLYLSYRYEERISRFAKTLAEIATEIEALRTPAGDQLLSATVADGYESKLASGLSVTPETLLEELHEDASGEEVSGFPIRWSDVTLLPVWDDEFQEEERSWTGTLWNTRISSYAVGLQKLAKATWGSLVADESVWGSRTFPIAGGQYLDSIYDVYLSFWEDPTDGAVYDAWQKRGMGGVAFKTGAQLARRGVLETDLASGVGGRSDLKVTVGSDDHELFTEDEPEPTVSLSSDPVEVPEGATPATGGVELP